MFTKTLKLSIYSIVSPIDTFVGDFVFSFNG